MRILIPCLHYFKDRPSGSTRLAYDEAVTLAQMGHDVWMIGQTQSRNSPEYEWDSEAKIHVLRHVTPRSGFNLWQRLIGHQYAVRELMQRVAPKQFDVIHGHSLLQLQGAVDSVKTDTVIGYSVHSPVLLEYRASGWCQSLAQRVRLEVRGQALARIERSLLQRADFITSDSQFTKSVVTNLYGDHIGNRIDHMPGWVNTKHYGIPNDRQQLKQQLGWPTDRPVFFTLRRLTPRNGIQTLLYAAKVLHAERYTFHVVIGGRGPLEKTLRDLTAELQISNMVSFIGHLPEDHLPSAYGAANLFVLPTARLECFGLIILEAFAAGTPVIGTPVGAIPELIQPIDTRWIAQENTAAALAEIMRSYLEGTLPMHPSEMLRAYAMQFNHETSLAKLVNYVLEHV